MNEINTGSDTQYFVSCNPLLEVYHNGEIQNATARSGQPILVLGDDRDSVMELIFLLYSEDGDGDILDTTPHECNWSTYDSEVEAQEIIDKLNTYAHLQTNSIKHPIIDQWAVTVSDQVFMSLPEGETKTWLYNKAVESITLGHRHDRAYMISQGWV